MLAKPGNEIVVFFPVKMDDGRIEMLTGYRGICDNGKGYNTVWPTEAYIVPLPRLETTYKQREISP